MMRKLLVCSMVAVFLLLFGLSVQALTSHLTLDQVTRKEMILKGMVDYLNIDIVVIDQKTNQTIGKAALKADAKGQFLSNIALNPILGDYNDLLVRVTDSSDDEKEAKKTSTEYTIFIDCFPWEQQVDPENDPCQWKVRSVRVVGDTMG